MHLRLDEIPEEGLRVQLDMDCSWAVGAVSTALDGVVKELSGSLRVRPMASGIMVTGDASVLTEQHCDRCLATLLLRLGGDVDLYFEAGRLEGDSSINLHQDELDVGFLDDGSLDLAAALGEFFLLEAPTRLRCEDPGVTQVEKGPCELASAQPGDQPPIDPRLAALKNFQSD